MAHYCQDFCKETGIVQEFAVTNTPHRAGGSWTGGVAYFHVSRWAGKGKGDAKRSTNLVRGDQNSLWPASPRRFALKVEFASNLMP